MYMHMHMTGGTCIYPIIRNSELEAEICRLDYVFFEYFIKGMKSLNTRCALAKTIGRDAPA
jgi:hypothetical protein